MMREQTSDTGAEYDASDASEGRDAGNRAVDMDPRRNHAMWKFLREGRVELCDGLTALAATWRNVEIGHELELAVAATDVWRQVDALLGEHSCRIWYALLELRDATPTWRAPGLEQVLSPAADPRVVAALTSVRATAVGVDSWGGLPEVRDRLAELGDALRDLALGHRVPDVLAPRQRAPAGVHETATSVDARATPPPLTLGEPHLRLLP